MAINSKITPTAFNVPNKGDKILSSNKPDANTQLLEAITKLQGYADNVDNCGNCTASNCCQSCQKCQGCQSECNCNCNCYSH